MTDHKHGGHSAHSSAAGAHPNPGRAPIDSEIDVRRTIEIGLWLGGTTIGALVIGYFIYLGLSKWTGAGGWRLGAFIFPEELRGIADAMLRLSIGLEDAADLIADLEQALA